MSVTPPLPQLARELRPRTDAEFRARAGKKASAAAVKYQRVGVVRKKLKAGRNTVKVKRIRKHKLTRGRYRATIAATAGGKRLDPFRVNFKIKR